MSGVSVPTNRSDRNAKDNRGGRRLLRRGPWENASTAVIGLGIVMLMQPFSMQLFSYSFTVILAGTLGFIVTSHFRE